MQTQHLHDGGELVEGMTDVLLRHLVGYIVHVDSERLLRTARYRDLHDKFKDLLVKFVSCNKIVFERLVSARGSRLVL